MASIIPFPARAAAVACPGTAAALPARPLAEPLPSTGGRRCEYAVGDLARMLGIAHFSPRTVIGQLRALARDRAMPLPRTPRLRCGQVLQGPRAIWLQSRWDAEVFDAWQAGMDGDATPPPASAALRAELARRAESIGTPRRQVAR